jgi:nicotinate phosphoribosyltransferase
MNKQNVLLVDQYELVMAYCYWQLGMANKEAVFELSFRRNPFKGNYTVACGLDRVIDFLQNFRFDDSDIDYLKTLTDSTGKQALFSAEFLAYLQQLEFTCDVDAISEGSIVFPQEPLLRIKGPILQCQLLETALVNFLNFSSLIATKASRVYLAAEGASVVEFGVRRAQGPDGGLTSSRAAYIGGCAGTSHMLAGKIYGIPTKGTQAHSWIMAFDKELDSFQAFAQIMAENTFLLVDTYNTLEGIKNAIKVGLELRKQGKDLRGVRLDSGDLASLSKTARELLDAAGFNNTQIMASGELDEYAIAQLKMQQAPIDIWGVGTRLVTAADQPYLDTVYKLTAIEDEENQTWKYKIKVSDQPGKMTLPGIHQVRRYSLGSQWVGDIIYDVTLGLDKEISLVFDHEQDLLVPIFRQGKLVYRQSDIHEIRNFCITQLKLFSENAGMPYSVKLAENLAALQQSMLFNYSKQ